MTVDSGLRRVFAQYRPDLVFHTAAHKHVYLMERAGEAARNNVLGTKILADIAEEMGWSVSSSSPRIRPCHRPR